MQPYVNPERLVPISDVLFKTEKGKELYRLTALKVRLRLANQGIKQHKSLCSEIAKEVGLKVTSDATELLSALQTKLVELSIEIYKEHLIREQISAFLIKFLSLGRCALAQAGLSGTWRVSFYDNSNVQDSAKASVEVDDVYAAEEIAILWVTEGR